MNPLPPHPSLANNANEPSPAPLKRAACLALLLLIAGYIVFNRSFAKLGFSPLYVGELVLALGLCAALFDAKTVFFKPLRHSRAMILIALFILYGLIRIAIDSPSRGMDAARDGVVCTYALFAFLAPWLLGRAAGPAVPLSPRERADVSESERGVRESASNSISAISRLRPLVIYASAVTFAALIYAASIYLGWLAPFSDVKVDFLALSTAIAFSVWLCLSLFLSEAKKTSAALSFFKNTAVSIVVLWEVYLLYALPTRALWPAPLVIALVIALAQSFSHRSIKLLAVWVSACLLALILFFSFNSKLREKTAALLDPNDSHFATKEGQRAAHSVKWRLIFWRKCIDETARYSPLFGVGFGTNLTDLLRETPDWPIFEDSQNAAKYGAPNRNPHSAHVSILTRLGGLGFFLWLGILGCAFMSGLWNCRYSIKKNSRAQFWFATALLCCWSIYVLAMSFGVVLENPFGGIPFWTLTGLLAQPLVLETPRPLQQSQ